MTLSGQNDVYGLVLAGGFSKRMQQDKASLRYHNCSQIAYCERLLASVCEKSFLSCRPNQDFEANDFQLEKIEDSYEDIGPVGGVLSAMNKFPDKAWLVLACDLPFLDQNTLQFLLQNRDSKKMATCYKSVERGFPEPLCTIYEAKFFDTMLDFVEKGAQCPRKMLICSEVKELAQPNQQALQNINFAEELEQARLDVQKISSSL